MFLLDDVLPVAVAVAVPDILHEINQVFEEVNQTGVVSGENCLTMLDCHRRALFKDPPMLFNWWAVTGLLLIL